MIMIETTMFWLGLINIVFVDVPRWMFPALLPVDMLAFAPMLAIHEIIVHSRRVMWFTSGFR